MQMEKEKDMVFTYIKTNINIAGIGKIIKKVDKVCLSLKKMVDMKAILKMENVMVLVPFFMLMVMYIKENGKTEKKMGKVYIHFQKIKKDSKDSLVMITLLEVNGMSVKIYILKVIF